LISSRSWSSKTVAQSWFSTKLYTAPRLSLPRIFSPSLPCSPAACTGSDNTVTKSRKIRCSPSPAQRQTLKRWCGASRFVFNRTVEYLKQPGTKASWKGIKSEILRSLPDWCAAVPYQIKSVAIRDACKAVTMAKRRIKAGEKSFVSFRSRKDPVQSFYVPKSAVSRHGIYHTLLGPLCWREAVLTAHGDCRLVCAYGAYYLAISVTVPRRKAENQGRVVALDPGLRSFITFYAEDSCGKLGTGDFSRMQRLCAHLDRLISRADTARSKPAQRLYKACDRLRQQIRHLIDELHHKVALFLVQHFDVILLPTFETKQMVSKGARKLRKKSVRSMLHFAHHRFKLFLKHKAFEYGKTVIDVCEAYTSKTVSWTGEIISNLGGRKVIQSKLDGQRMDRDFNGARGILLRALEDTPLVRDLLAPCIANEC
jgi:putative transposase